MVICMHLPSRSLQTPSRSRARYTAPPSPVARSVLRALNWSRSITRAIIFPRLRLCQLMGGASANFGLNNKWCGMKKFWNIKIIFIKSFTLYKRSTWKYDRSSLACKIRKINVSVGFCGTSTLWMKDTLEMSSEKRPPHNGQKTGPNVSRDSIELAMCGYSRLVHTCKNGLNQYLFLSTWCNNLW